MAYWSPAPGKLDFRIDGIALLPRALPVTSRPRASLDDARRSSQASASTSGRGFLNPIRRSIRSATTTHAGNGAAPEVEAPSLRPGVGLGGKKEFDLVALSNLCVDIVVQTDSLPPPDETSRRALLEQLTADPPPTTAWEVGGNTNTLIAASRLGLKVASVGHVGRDVYGKFLSDVLKVREKDIQVAFVYIARFLKTSGSAGMSRGSCAVPSFFLLPCRARALRQ